jgi:hypothetical protein
MSELKTNTALGLSILSIILNIANFSYTSNKLKALESKIADVNRYALRIEEGSKNAGDTIEERINKHHAEAEKGVKELRSTLNETSRQFKELKELNGYQLSQLYDALQLVPLSDDERRVFNKFIKSFSKKKAKQAPAPLPSKKVRFESDSDSDINDDDDDEEVPEAPPARRSSSVPPASKGSDDSDVDSQRARLQQLRENRRKDAQRL